MKHNPCDICIDKCPTNGVCDCSKCKSKDCCPKLLGLSATIRITTKCTQSCSHCCFECSPKEKKMMTIKVAKKIGQFYKNNPMYFANIMGGEIYCNPKYQRILEEIIPNTPMARVVTNADWVKGDPGFIDFIAQFKNVYMAISNDKYHTNEHIEKAVEMCKERGVMCKLADYDVVKEDSVVPVGKSQFEYNIYSMMGTYCSNPEHKYSFMIDEDGEIYKCGFAIWDYANINDYLDGGFGERFKEFCTIFHNTFIASCTSCIRGYQSLGGERKKATC